MLGEQFRWVHVVRDPTYCAGSLVTHFCYDRESPFFQPEWNELVYLHPTDPGVSLGDMADSWADMNDFEKCLFYWFEVNNYGIELAKIPELKPAAVVRFEDVFAGGTQPLLELYRAVGLPDPKVLDLSRIDRYRRRSPINSLVRYERLWREVARVGQHFAYQVNEDLRSADLNSVSRYFSHYTRNARGAKGFKKARRMVKALVLDMLGR